MTQGGYASHTKLQKNEWITDPLVDDPENLPEPLGWTLLVRPYPVKQDEKKTTLILAPDNVDYMSHLTNIARVVSVGPTCWNRPEHRDKEGNQFDWLKEGDFITYPRNVGARRKFKGVSYVLLVDDEVTERLPDPQVFDDDLYKLDVPEEHLTKYNTVYNKESK